MLEEYTKEQIWKLYEKLPQELKDVFFSEETGDNIYNICKRNNVLGKLDRVVEYVGRVLLGVLTLDEFRQTLEKELELDPEVAKKVYQEIFRLIFYPIKTSLEELYKIEIAPIAGTMVKPSPREKLEKEKEPEGPKKTDIYRELVE